MQDRVQVEVGPDREDRIEQPFELPFDLPVVAAFHPVTVRGRSPAPWKGTGDPPGGLGGDDQVVAVRPPQVDEPEDHQHRHHCGGDEGADRCVAGDHADRRPGEGGQQQASQRLALEERVPLGCHSVGLGLQLGDGSLRLAVVDRFGDRRRGGPLDGAEVGVGLAVGDPFEVPVDEAGVGLGLRARGDLLAGVLDEVRSSLAVQRLGVGERDVLRGQLVMDVVVGEVGAIGEQAAGDDERPGGDDADADHDLVDRPSAHGDDGLGQGVELGADLAVDLVDLTVGRGGGHICYLLR